MRSGRLVKRAVDLGTAFEVLLTPDHDGELSYRLSQRGAIAGGGSSEEKVERFALLRKFYELRSRAVHSGAFSDSYDWREDGDKYYEKIVSADKLFCAVAKNLVTSGRIRRDWKKEVFEGHL